MSVLIKCIEMPKSCMNCMFCGFAGADCELDLCQITGSAQKHIPHSKMPDCPLIEVPPHGRLGDLDRLEQMFVDIDNAPYSGFDGEEPFYSAEDAAQIIRLAPTIIPAEESNMDSFIRIFEEDDEDDGMDSFIRILKD